MAWCPDRIQQVGHVEEAAVSLGALWQIQQGEKKQESLAMVLGKEESPPNPNVIHCWRPLLDVRQMMGFKDILYSLIQKCWPSGPDATLAHRIQRTCQRWSRCPSSPCPRRITTSCDPYTPRRLIASVITSQEVGTCQCPFGPDSGAITVEVWMTNSSKDLIFGAV